MSAGVSLDTPGQKIGQFVFWVPMVFCSMEMIPGWGFINPDWPREVYYAIMATSGALAGMLILPKHLVPGLVGGLLAGPGGLFAVALLLENVQSTHTLVIVAVALLGCLPGIGIGLGLKALQDRVVPPPSDEMLPLPVEEEPRHLEER